MLGWFFLGSLLSWQAPAQQCGGRSADIMCVEACNNRSASWPNCGNRPNPNYLADLNNLLGGTSFPLPFIHPREFTTPGQVWRGNQLKTTLMMIQCNTATKVGKPLGYPMCPGNPYKVCVKQTGNSPDICTWYTPDDTSATQWSLQNFSNWVQCDMPCGYCNTTFMCTPDCPGNSNGCTTAQCGWFGFTAPAPCQTCRCDDDCRGDGLTIPYTCCDDYEQTCGGPKITEVYVNNDYRPTAPSSQTVTIKGRGFLAGRNNANRAIGTVWFNPENVSVNVTDLVTSWTDTDIILKMPKGFGANRRFTVVEARVPWLNASNPLGNGVLRNATAADIYLFSYNRPVITTFYPDFGSTDGLENGSPIVVTLTGTDFSVNKTVLWNGVPVTPLTWTDVGGQSKITLNMPPGTGRVNVTVVAHNDANNMEYRYSVQVIYNKPVINAGAIVSRSAGQNLTITGSNFGIWKERVTVTIGGLACPVQTVTHQQIICIVPMGSGTKAPLRVIVDGLIDESGAKFPYPPPVLNQLIPNDVPTARDTVNNRLTIVGDNFGSGPTNELNSYVRVGSFANGLDRICNNDTICNIVSWNNTVIIIWVPEGPLESPSPPTLGHAVQVSAGQPSDSQFSNQRYFTYSRPFISNLAGQNGSPTGDLITVTGGNFGRSGFGNISVGVNPGATGVPGNCIREPSQTHSQIICRMPSGLGLGKNVYAIHSYNITAWSNISSTFWPYNYAAPILQGVSPSTNRPTQGNTTSVASYITLTGQNFGLNADRGSSSESFVKVGGVSGSDCPIFSWSNIQVVCSLPAGTGTNKAVNITAMGQTSTQHFPISYGQPDITDIVFPGSKPTSGYIITVIGINFGATKPANDKVQVNGVASIALVTWNHTYFVATLPQGQGNAQSLTVNIDGQTLANAKTVSYDAPTITGWVGTQNAGNTYGYNADNTVTISGTSFGKDTGTVTIGGDSVRLIRSWTHDTIVVDHGPGSGRDQPIKVTCAITGFTFTTVTNAGFNFKAPVIVELLQGPSALDTSDWTAGGGIITVSGLHFGQLGDSTITIDGKSCPIVNGTYNSTEQVLLCRVPAGQGESNSLVVRTDGQNSNSLPFSYRAPILNGLVSSDGTFPTLGGKVITVTGFSLGVANATVDLINPLDQSAIRISATYQNHTVLTFTLPQGSGEREVKVTVEGRGNVAQNPVDGSTVNVLMLRYDLPVISTVLPVGLNTQGGLVTITGVNFGAGTTPSNVVVTVGSFGACSVQTVSQGQITCLAPAGQGTPVVSVQANGRLSVVDNTKQLVYGSPSISNITLFTSLPTMGNTFVAIQGSNFGIYGIAAQRSVRVGDFSRNLFCTEETAGNHTYIRCKMPAGVGRVPVVVRVESLLSNAVNVTYDGPVVTQLVTTTVPTLGGVVLTVRGSNFGAALADWTSTTRNVSLGGKLCQEVAWTDIQITCAIPPGQGTGLKVFVFVGNLTSADANNGINYDPPQLGSSPLSPTSGPTQGGIRIDLYGRNFGQSGVVTLVYNAISEVCPLIGGEYSDIAIGCTLPKWDYAPPGANGLVTIQITVSGQTLQGTAVTFQYQRPSLTALTPASGPTSGGAVGNVDQLIVLTGSSFGFQNGTVTVGGKTATVYEWNHTSIKFWHPAGTGTSTEVYAIAKDGRTNAAPLTFAYLSPQILTVSPLSALTGPDRTNLTMTGVSLGSPAVTTITIGGMPCNILTFTVGSPDTIICAIPLGQGRNLPVIVNVTGIARTHSSTFNYISPSLTAINPGNGPTAGGGTVRITGTSLGTSGTVTIGGFGCQITTYTHSYIDCRVPAGQGENLAVVLALTTTPVVTSSGSVRYGYDGPTVSSTSPQYLPTKGGTDLVIFGENFGVGGDSPVTITLGGVNCPLKFPLTTFLKHCNVTCVVPEYESFVSTTALTILVKAQVLQKVSSNLVYVQYQRPQVSGVAPLNGKTNGGRLITIDGLNFGKNPSVLVGTKVCPITSGGLTAHIKIICTVPAGEGVNLTVSVVNGLSSTETWLFSYDPPEITGVSPNYGPTAGSTVQTDHLTISGSSFGTGGAVYIGTTQCSGCSWGHSQIVCPIPPGQGQNRPVHLDVTNRARVTWSGTFTYNEPAISSISKPQFNPTQGGGVLVVLGVNFGLSGSVTVGGVSCPVITGAYSHTRVECTIPAGIGNANSVVLTVTGDRSSAPKLYGYDRPVLTSLSPTTGRTVGDFNLTLTGQNFGPPGLPASSTLVSIAMEDNSGNQVAVDCPVYPAQSNHTQLVCDMPQGIGKSLPVSVSIGGSTVATTAPFSFLSPEIIKVNGCLKNTDCCTEGCPIETSETITITGDNFGPLGKVSNSLPFVPALPGDCKSVVCVKDKACSNVVQLSHTQVTCQTPNRTFGLNVTVRLIAGNPTLQAQKDYISFLAPTINMSSFMVVATGERGLLRLNSTSGGQKISFTGSGFGNDISLVKVEYALIDSDGKVVPKTLRLCTVASVSDTIVECITTAGVGQGLSLRVTAQNPTLGVDQTSSWTNANLASISYPAPVITPVTLRPASSDQRLSHVVGSESTGEALKFDARNLGLVADASLISLTYGPAGGPYTFTASAIELEKDHAGYVRFLTQQGLGGPYVFRLQVLNQAIVGTDSYEYPVPPIVYAVIGGAPCVADSVVPNKTVECPTEGGVTLTIMGANFNPDKSTIKIGVQSCDSKRYISNGELRCVLASGTGLDRLVSVSVGKLSSAPLPLLSYAVANLSTIFGCPKPTVAGNYTEQCPRTGAATNITLTGNNFGPRDALVLVQGVPVTTWHDATDPHKKVLFALPLGVAGSAGLNRSVIIVQANGAPSTNVLSLSYKPCQPSTHEVAGSITCQPCTVGKYSDLEGLAECKPCGLGYYANAGSLTACTACEQGRVVKEVAAQSCVECRPGTFSGGTGQTSCASCPEGRIAPGNASASCSACNAGTFQANAGETVCANCTTGRFSPINGSLSCEVCSPGFASPERSSKCEACDEGFHQPDPEQAQCDECPLGRSNPIPGQAACLACTAGFFANDTTLSFCLKCPAGYVSNSAAQGASSCSACVKGEYSSEPGQATCLLCPKGRATNTTASVDCQKCAIGYYANTAASFVCKPCNPGKYAPLPETVDCLDCPAGRVTTGSGAIICEACTGGSYAPGSGLSSCELCEQGKASNSTAQASCRPCVSGKYANSTGMRACRLCEAGYYSLQTLDYVGPTACTPCIAGRVSSEGSDRCSDCPVGYVQNQPGRSICNPCAAGKFAANPGLQTCASCNPGYFSEGGAFSCTACPKGTFSGAEAGSCTICDEGYIGTNPAASQCSSCSPGFFIGVDGASVCLPCPRGTFSSGFNATSCTECSAGSVAPEEESTSCTACDQGTFAPSPGLDQCLECPLGSANPAVSVPTVVCNLCPAGRHAKSLGSTSCELCLAGYFSPLNGSAECTPCPEGQITNQSGLIVCTICEEGTYNPTPGQDECLPCDTGRFASAKGQIGCSLCPAGSFTNISGEAACTLCGMGYAQPLPGKSSCVQCDSGNAASSQGALFCRQCGAGRYSNITEGPLVACKLCGPGYFQGQQGKGSCDQCPSGRAQDQDGQAFCTVCDSGLYAPTPGTQLCAACEAGSFSGASTTGIVSCTDCPRGQFVGEPGQSVCVDCPSGKYNNHTRQSACVSCPAGKKQPLRGQYLCDDCTAGRYAAYQDTGTAECLICGQGTFSLPGSGQCTPCSPGYRQPLPEQSSCLLCGSGQFGTAQAQAVCVDCPSGTYANMSQAVRTSCVDCPAGKYQTATKQTDCDLCPAGYFTDKEGQFACVACLPGYYNNQPGMTECEPCPAGYVYPGFAATICNECDVGEYQDVVGMLTCSLCPSGSFGNSSARSTPCLLCPEGKYQDQPGKDGCLDCPSGTYIQGEGQLECVQCNPGRYSNATGSAKCRDCPAGKSSSSYGAQQCVDCEEGKFEDTQGALVCRACPAGTYVNVKGATQCLPCLAGYYQSGTGRQSCIPCPVATYGPSDGQSFCIACPAGRFNDATNQLSCSTCPQGTAGPPTTNGLETCPLCAVGYFNGFTGQSACAECPVGRFSNSTGLYSCFSCPAGKSGPGTRLSSCTNCVAGYYQGLQGQFSCTPAPAGSFVATAGQTTFQPCPVGTFTSATSQTSCQNCAIGYSQPYQGQKICIKCLAGRTAIQTGLANCVGCPPARAVSFSGSTQACPLCAIGKYQDSAAQSSCRDCPIGKFGNTTGLATCYECPAGYISTKAGSQICDPCIPGQHVSLPGQFLCSQCEPGRATDQYGQPECPTCPGGRITQFSGNTSCSACADASYSITPIKCASCERGRFGNGTGADRCAACPGGTYQDEFGKTSCKNCIVATYSLPGSEGCMLCEAGKANDMQGQSFCLPCVPGRYQPEYGKRTCQECPVGEYQERFQEVGCDQCPPGRFVNKTAALNCSRCDYGEQQPYFGSVGCQLCPMGSYGDEQGLDLCKLCPPGTFGNKTGLMRCYACPRGFHQETTNSTECDQCPPGKFSPEDTNGCEPCPQGKYSDTNATLECTLCPPGRFSDKLGVRECEPCPKGKYSNSTDNPIDCLLCESGKFTNTTGNKECKLCGLGLFAPNPNASACIPCPQGTTSAALGASICDPCASGKYAILTGQTECQTCGNGTFSDPGAINCTWCEKGKSSNALHVQCDKCLPGKFSNQLGLSSCLDCYQGEFQPGLGHTDCDECQVGRFNKETGKVECKQCGVGTFANDTGLTACILCLQGYHQSSTGKRNCTACLPGQHASYRGQVECTLCEPGRATNSFAKNDCDKCSPGFFTETYGNTTCNPCPIKTFSETYGAEYCSLCDAGFYNNVTGKSACFPCPAGTSQIFFGQTNCTECQPGYFTQQSGLASCIQCLPGRYSPTKNGTTCLACGVGYVNQNFAASSCGTCSPGQEPVAKEASDSCISCVPGSFYDGFGVGENAVCRPCTGGKFSPTMGATTCTICAKGSVASSGATVCDVCTAGKVQPLAGQAECAVCDPNAVTNAQGTECLCKPGYFGRPIGTPPNGWPVSEFCKACAEGMDCTGYGTMWNNYNTLPGYWTASAGKKVTAAPAPSEGDFLKEEEISPVFYRCQYSSQCLGGQASECIDRREGPLCSVCEEGYYSFFGGTCALCPESKSSIIYLVFLMMVFGTMYTLACWLLLYNVRILNRLEKQEQIMTMMRRETDAGKMARQVFETDMRRKVAESKYDHPSNKNMKPEKPGKKKAHTHAESMSISQRLAPPVQQKVKPRWSKFFGGTNKKAVGPKKEPALYQTTYLDSAGRVIFASTLTYKLKIIIGFFQILSNMGVALELPWPLGYKKFISFFSLFNFDIFQAANVECVYPRGQVYYRKYVFIRIIPLIVTAAPVLFYAVPRLIYAKMGCSQGQRVPLGMPGGMSQALEADQLMIKLSNVRIWLKTVKLILFGLFLVYPTVSSTVLRLYNCKKVENVWYLLADFNTVCYTDDWYHYAKTAWVFGILYAGGIPFLFFCLLFFTRRLPGGLSRPRALISLGFLYNGYDRNKFWFEMLEMCHKLALVAMIPFIEPRRQIQVSLVIVGVFGCIILLANPYKRWTDDAMHLLAQFYIFLFVYIAMLLRMEPLDAKTDTVFSVLMIAMTMFFFAVGFAGLMQHIILVIRRYLGLQEKKHTWLAPSVNELTGIQRTQNKYKPSLLTFKQEDRESRTRAATGVYGMRFGKAPHDPSNSSSPMTELSRSIAPESKKRKSKEPNTPILVRNGSNSSESDSPKSPSTNGGSKVGQFPFKDGIVKHDSVESIPGASRISQEAQVADARTISESELDISLWPLSRERTPKASFQEHEQ
eukprot:g59215.t1